MSFHQLGIAHFPVLHRQFSSPTTQSFAESSPDQDITQDNKDVLIERLNDMVSRLSKSSGLKNSVITAIHSEVDHIEVLMRDREKPQKSDPFGFDGRETREDNRWGPPMSPTRNVRMRFADIPHSPLRPPPMSPSRAVEIAQAAEVLSSKLEVTVLELQARKEESDHLHDLLITRAEKAAERILLLEYRIAEMGDDFEANQSELRFLRIQLQAIEAQCAQYVPRDEDSELTRSIMNWKVDWEGIDQRSKARRKKCHISVSSIDGSHQVIDDS